MLAECEKKFAKIKSQKLLEEGTNAAFVSRNGDLGGLQKRILSNALKREIYCNAELVRLDIEDLVLDGELSADDATQDLIKRITMFTSDPSMALSFVDREIKWWDKIDELVRAAGVWLCVGAFAVFLALPCIVLRPFEDALIAMQFLKSTWAPSNIVKWAVAHSLMIMAGIQLKVEMEPGAFCDDRRMLVCYTHTSTMDAFIITGAIPCRYIVMAKQELFMLPFFSWLLIAFGGQPVDRKNQARSVDSMKSAAKSLMVGDAVSVAPEGTRSSTGQLMDFKKGPGHIWEQMEARVVPMTIFGAFELYPVGKIISLPGHVHVHFLKPFDPESITDGAPDKSSGGTEEASKERRRKNRERMGNRTRRALLEDLAHQPAGVAAALEWPERMLNVATLVLFFAALRWLCLTAAFVLFEQMQLTGVEAVCYIGGSSVAITAVLFVWVVHGSWHLAALVALASAVAAYCFDVDAAQLLTTLTQLYK